MAQYFRSDKTNIVLYFGDYDPSGQDIERYRFTCYEVASLKTKEILKQTDYDKFSEYLKSGSEKSDKKKDFEKVP